MPIRVTARHPIRRAGRPWPEGVTEVEDGDLTAAQLAALRAEPELSVEDAPPEEPPEEPPTRKSRAKPG